MEYSGLCANEKLLEQPFCTMELFMHTADSEYDHSFSELLVHKISDLMCAPEGPSPHNTVALRVENHFMCESSSVP